MFDDNILEAVSERDIDLLILEELNVSRDFSDWFYRENGLTVPSAGLSKALHSIADPELGESDLIAFYSNGHAILIENKINAIAQPQQAERYQQRGERGIKSGDWKSFSTCMIAPQVYLEGSEEAPMYDKTISYEKIKAWFTALETQRGKYRVAILEAAIDQGRRGYVAIPDQDATNFWQSYYDYTMVLFPKLRMNQVGDKPSRSTYIYFHPLSLPDGYQLVHKFEKGVVDLQIPNMPNMAATIAQAFSDLGLEIDQAQQSVVFRKRVRVVDLKVGFTEQREHVHEALLAAEELAGMASGIKE